MLHTWSKNPASVLHSKCRSTEGWLSHFFEIASTGIAEVTWRRAPIHTKIGRFSCCDFYSFNCPSLGIATAAKQKYSPPGHWDVRLQWRKKPLEQEEPLPPPIKPHGAGAGTTAVQFCQSRARITEHWSTFKPTCPLLRSPLWPQIPAPLHVHTKGKLCVFHLLTRCRKAHEAHTGQLWAQEPPAQALLRLFLPMAPT